MTQEHQQRLARVLVALSQLYPDWRLGQIVANVAGWARGPTSEAVWDVEDAEFLEAAESHIKHRLSEKAREKQSVSEN